MPQDAIRCTFGAYKLLILLIRQFHVVLCKMTTVGSSCLVMCLNVASLTLIGYKGNSRTGT